MVHSILFFLCHSLGSAENGKRKARWLKLVNSSVRLLWPILKSTLNEVLLEKYLSNFLYLFEISGWCCGLNNLEVTINVRRVSRYSSIQYSMIIVY